MHRLLRLCLRPHAPAACAACREHLSYVCMPSISLCTSRAVAGKCDGFHPPAGLAALLHCELAVGISLPGASAPWTTLHMPVGIA